MGIRVLVTGVSGFLGSWAVKGLADAGHQAIASNVRCQDRLFRAILPETTPDQVTWRGLDVDDNDVVDTIVGEAAPEAIVHLAARLIPACRDEPAAAQVNVVGHINVFEAARRHGVGQVVYASSLAARLRHDDGAHRTICGTFKHWNETFAATYFTEYGLPSVGLRPAIVYGPGREAGATAFVNQAIAATAANEPYQLPQRWCSRLEYVEQVAAIFRQCAEAPLTGALASDASSTLTTDDDFITALGRLPPAAGLPTRVINRSRRPRPMASPRFRDLSACGGMLTLTTAFAGQSTAWPS